MTVVNLVIGASGNDAHQYSTTYTATQATVELGNHSSASITSAFRFLSATVAQGTTITSAIFTVKSQATYTGPATLKVKIFCENVDNSAALATGLTSRTATTANTPWDCHALTAEADYALDITTAVQEVINRAGWVSGNALTVLIRNDTAPAGEWQDVYSYDGAPAKVAKLDITYSSGSASLATPPPGRVYQHMMI